MDMLNEFTSWGRTGLDWVVKPLAGAVAVWAGTWLYRWYRDRQYRKRHSLKGTYLGVAEGERNGTSVKDKELIEVKQSISEFDGTASNVDHTREWSIDGEIIDQACLTGSYRSTIPTDQSRGTFFLEPENGSSGNYTGFWAGYDPINKMVKCGKYQWRKLLECTSRTLMNDSQLRTNALAILSDSLGQRYIDEATFQQYLDAKSSRFALGAFCGEDIVGVTLAKFLETEHYTHYEAAAKKAGFSMPLSQLQLVGHLKSIAVKDGWRGKGVGTFICKKAIEDLKKKGCTAVFTVAWESGHAQSSISMFKTLGFDIIGEVKEFWKKSDSTPSHRCPKCGDSCTCTAIFCLLKKM